MNNEKDNESRILEEILAQLKQNSMPERLWSANDIATYVGLATSTIRQTILCLPDFPDAVRIPYVKEGKKRKTDPRWEAKDVKAWILRHRKFKKPNRKTGRPRAS